MGAPKTIPKNAKRGTEAGALKTPRRLKKPLYKKGLLKRQIHPGPKLPSSFTIFKRALRVLHRNRRIFAGITAIYGLLTVVLVRGLSNSAQLSATKQSLASSGKNGLGKGLSLVGSLFGSGSSTESTGATYQTFLIILVSLAVIWVLRQVYDSVEVKPIPAKLAFYCSTGPLIQFLGVSIVLSLQLIPAVIGGTIYATVINNVIAVTAVEHVLWAGLFFALTVWSFYMITPTVIALYIVTIPETRPRQAIKAAKRLVKYRRWTMMRKVLFLPLFLTVFLALVLLPIALWLTPVAEWIFFLLGLVSLSVVHAYYYCLYRELL